MKRIVLVIFTFFLMMSLMANDRHKLDSLISLDNEKSHDTAKVRDLWNIGYEYEFINPDSSLLYYNEAIEISRRGGYEIFEAKSLQTIALYFLYSGQYDTAVVVFKKAIEFSRSIDYKDGIASNSANCAVIYTNTGQYKLAKTSFIEALASYENSDNEKEIANTCTNLGVVCFYMDLYDSAFYYQARAFEIYNKMDYKPGIANYYNNTGNIFDVQGQYDKAEAEYKKALEVYVILKDKKGESSAWSNLGIVATNKGDFPKALEYYQKALELKEEVNDQYGMSSTLLNIGIVHSSLANYEQALDYFNKALEINLESGDTYSQSCCYVNIGSICRDQNKYEEAIQYFEKAMKIDKTSGDQRGVVMNMSHIANVYTLQGSYEEAMEYFEEAIFLSKSLGIERETSSLKSSIATNLLKQGKYNMALKYAKEAAHSFRNIGAPEELLKAYFIQSEAYDSLGNFRQAYLYHKLFYKVKDSVFGVEKMRTIEEMEKKYQAEKKQHEIEKLESEKTVNLLKIEKSEAENKKQKVIILSFIVGFIVILIFSVIILRLFIQKRKANTLLAFQNDEIKQKNEEITSQRDEIEAQRDEITNQRDMVIHQKEEIEDSIRYAKRIQNAVLPSTKLANSILGEHFIIFRPKDVVSGDFYWATEVNNWIIVTAADCTGHGVPGAFMCMLGVSFLNEIVRKKEVTNAGEVLNNLRASIIEALQQVGESQDDIQDLTSLSVKDGMDMSLVAIHKSRKHAMWSGANNPIYHLRGGEMIEIKGDKMPVAIYDRMDNYTNHEFSLDQEDKLYMFSDGYPDQFGGEKGKKFKIKSFRKLIVETSNLSMADQCHKLNEALDNWMTHIDPESGIPFEQVDDITVIGLKI